MIKYLTVHCSATPNGRDERATDIHRWHVEQGWDGIGYHAVVTVDAHLEQGRPDYWPGAHVRGFNDASLGICLIGTDNFSDDMLRVLEGWLVAKKAEYPEAQIVGHRDLDSHKSCPNFDVKKWWAQVSANHLG